jgi:MoxR-like ATPase
VAKKFEKSDPTKPNRTDVEAVRELNESYQAVRNEIAKVIVGQDTVIEQLFISLLSRGHCLLVGVPGLAKTLLIKTLADVLDLNFNRIQFTPDLMPSDITGTEIIEEDKKSGGKVFKFVQGPVFANIVLADEINRTPPKTQAALLESMQEHRVTAAGKTYTLDEPFFVLATQNPIEQEGTYPLPEAQLDRFMFNLWLEYPSFEEEKQIVKATTGQFTPKLKHVLSAEDIIGYQDLVRRVPVADNVIDYAVGLVAKTRPKDSHSSQFVKDWLTPHHSEKEFKANVKTIQLGCRSARIERRRHPRRRCSRPSASFPTSTPKRTVSHQCRSWKNCWKEKRRIIM